MQRWTSRLLPALVGLLALLTTAWLTQHERTVQQRDQRRHFDFSLRQAATRVEQRVASYEQMLRGVRGLFDASDEVTAQDFERYTDLLQSGADFAGLRGIGHAPLGGSADAPSARVAQVAPLAGSQLSPPGSDLLQRPALRAPCCRRATPAMPSSRRWCGPRTPRLAAKPGCCCSWPSTPPASPC